MILSNVEIHKALDEGRLIIKPEPSPRQHTMPSSGCPFDTTAVDLRLGAEIIVPHEEGPVLYDLTKPGSIASTIMRHSHLETISNLRPYRLEPLKFVLGVTHEWIHLPIFPDRLPCLAARLEGKSSRSRFGILVHFTAPTVHAGFEGNLTLEIANLGPADILLVPGMYIAQLIIEEVRGVPIEKPSQFQGQTTPAG